MEKISTVVMRMLLYQAVIFFLLYALHNSVQCYRILGVFPFAATSHYILGSSLMKGLAEAGHNVTIICPMKEKNLPKRGSYKEIELIGFKEEHEKMLEELNLLDAVDISMTDMVFKFMDMIKNLNDKIYENAGVKELLQSDEKFDAVVVEQFYVDSVKIFGHIYNAPVIVFSPVGATPWINNIVGNPSPPSYIPAMDTDFSPQMTFFERICNIGMRSMSYIMDYFYFPGQNEVLKKHFSNPPDILDLFSNVSFVLMNSHESLNQLVPYVPNMVQIGGFHVSPPKKLPKDLQEYLDNATEGVIYFSMGSNLKSKNFPPAKRDAFLTAFGKLKEKVLWKWEQEDLPGKPPNVRLAKWFPQQDILAHPNVKLFITHGGLLSTTETVYHGVPILAIPVFGDQHMNAKLATYSGYALSLPYEDPSFSEEKLSEMLNELLTNSQYRENAKRRSRLFHDRAMKPMDTAVYWVEYVIRNKGASHLKVAGADLPWYIYHSLDVVIFIALSTFVVIYLFSIIIRKLLLCWGICRVTSGKKSKRD